MSDDETPAPDETQSQPEPTYAQQVRAAQASQAKQRDNQRGRRPAATVRAGMHRRRPE